MRDATEGVNELANCMVETLDGGQIYHLAVPKDWARNSGRLLNQPIDALVAQVYASRTAFLDVCNTRIVDFQLPNFGQQPDCE
jgi:hypothetical protein